MAVPDKLIVSNRALLRDKYGAAAFDGLLLPALDRLVAADARRGLASRVVWLDSADDMQDVRGGPVSKRRLGPFAPAESGEYRRAVDALCGPRAPHYLVLLGGPDIVPHQPLPNAAYVTASANGDDDEVVDSDLPYASAAEQATEAHAIAVPSRVVGRLPDVPGKHGVEGRETFLRILDAAASGGSQPGEAYRRVLAISAEALASSTRATIASLFSAQTAVRLSPADGPDWPDADMEQPLHYINCHGTRNGIAFLGEAAAAEPGAARPTAHTAERVRAAARAGTVVVAESCFGAQLFDPDDAAFHGATAGEPTMGIVYQYLYRGAQCLFGSTCFSYGPRKDAGHTNDYADLLCARFVRHLLAGRSTGHAAQLARLDYAAQARTRGGVLDPIDQKTLAQFILVGDPSAHPVQRSPVAADEPRPEGAAAARAERRRRAARRADALRTTLRIAAEPLDAPTPASAAPDVQAIVRDMGFARPIVRRFRVRPAGDAAPAGEGPDAPTASYLIVEGTDGPASPRAGLAVTALEANGRLTNVRVARGS